MAFITAYWSLDGIIVLMTFILTVYFYMTYKFNYWKKRGVLHALPISIFGNFTDCLLLKRSPGYLLKDIYDQGKGMPYVGFYILDKPFLMIRDRNLIKNVLIKDFNYFNDRYCTPDITDSLAYTNLFFIKNPTWKLLRTKLTPNFTSRKLKQTFELMLKCSDNLDTYLESLSLEDKDVELEMKDLSSKFFMNIIATTAFGLNVDSLNNPDNEFRKYGKQIFEIGILHGYDFLMVLFIPSLVHFMSAKVYNKKVTDFLRNLFWQTITERIKSGEKRNDFIDIFIELKTSYGDQNSETGFKFDGDHLLAQAASFFAASFETSSTTVSFTLYELAKHPEIQDRLRKEILDALDQTDGKITYDMVLSLSYLDMVVSEVLRMYPALPFLDRVTTETYKIPDSDLVLEKNTPISISLLGVHYDPEYFPNPDEFDPERFTEENKRNRSSYVYLPFGDGPHTCIGIRMGLLQVKLGIITILRKYEVIPSEKTLIPMVIEPTSSMTAPLGGTIYLNVHKINNNGN
ncbi:PREDICTED: cytochrome P450 6k1-like isoform X1 [Cyphomyrmex costatus]|uniref:cytochrome P450 6k1-like isoform X1 n=1 Tax=Cyphomyrmex costatus TaxID=456900 RepID=UPI0008524286|nr:PREDICTED: cytochrome P450 6k1-like isoform X1 [Cyphomyrmex costatus]